MTLKVTGLLRHHAGNAEPTLKGLSFDLPGGTLTALLGRSGAGKSTVLRCVMGLEPFESGTIEIDGVIVRGTKDVSHDERQRQLHVARSRLGLVFQSFELFPHLSALDNCTLAPMKTKGLTRGQAETRARELLVQLGLEHRIDAYPEQLSGGQSCGGGLVSEVCGAGYTCDVVLPKCSNSGCAALCAVPCNTDSDCAPDCQCGLRPADLDAGVSLGGVRLAGEALRSYQAWLLLVGDVREVPQTLSPRPTSIESRRARSTSGSRRGLRSAPAFKKRSSGPTRARLDQL